MVEGFCFFGSSAVFISVVHICTLLHVLLLSVSDLCASN